METPLEVLARVKEHANRIKEKYRGNTDAEKAARAIAAFEIGYVELARAYGRDSTLLLLDPNKKQNLKKPTMYNVSERHIRRVETIRERRPQAAARLETIAMNGSPSLEWIEHLVINPPNADALEAMWLLADDEARDEFLRRLKLKK